MQNICIKVCFFILILPFGFLTQTVIAQPLTDQQHPIINASERLVYSDPNEAIKIALQLSKNENNSNSDKAKINCVLSKAYYIKGDYSSSLKIVFETKGYENYLSDIEKLDIEIYKIRILRDLSLDKESKKRLQLLEKRKDLIKDLKLKLYLHKTIALEKANFFVKEHQLEKGIQLLKGQLANSKQIFNSFPKLELSYLTSLGEFYLEKRDFITANKYFNVALLRIANQKNQNIYAKIHVLSGLADICFFQKEHDKVAVILGNALIDSQKIENVFLQDKITRQLNVNYLALNDTSNYKLTNANFIQIQGNLEMLEQEAVNTAYNLISKEYSDALLNNKKKYDDVIDYILLFVLMISIVFIAFWIKYSQREKNLQELTNYLQITRNKLINLPVEKKQEHKKSIILKETEEQILIKLKKFEMSKRFLNKDISLAILAGQFDTNTKYLSEIINSHYEINFNTYINRLRINYIIEKLKSDPNFIKYRISYLAENCGFASHSSFATVFKSVTGISPVKFIDFLKNEENLPEE
jgi:AraC-like DNA-binding protein